MDSNPGPDVITAVPTIRTSAAESRFPPDRASTKRPSTKKSYSIDMNGTNGIPAIPLDQVEATRQLLRQTSLSQNPAAQPNRNSDTPLSGSLSGTPLQTAPSSPRLQPRAQTLSVPGLTRSKISPDGGVSQTASKLVIVMVGLPARGKSYIVKKLARYFNWAVHDCRIFNCGDRRRTYSKNMTQDANFFDHKNADAHKVREQLAMDTLGALLEWLTKKNGTVGIFDATNSNRARRRAILDKIRQEEGLKVLFLESICTDTELLEANMRLKLNGPDYRDMDPVKALEDFKGRVRNYEAAYETIGEEEEEEGVSFCKVINVGKKVISHNIQGFLASQAVYFMLNFNLSERLIFVTRHGESEDNIDGRIGGNASLTERGRRYASALARLIDSEREKFRAHQLEQYIQHPRIIPKENDHWSENPTPRDRYYVSPPPPEKSFSVWTSMLDRSTQTADCFSDEFYDVKAFRMLDEINAGRMEKLTYDEIKEKYPKEYEARRKDKLRYRYPGSGGESYLDVIYRLNPIIVEIERAEHHILMISHRVISRILLSYFLNLSRDQVTELDVPLETAFLMVPRSYGSELKKFSWDCVSDTWEEASVSAYTNVKT